MADDMDFPEVPESDDAVFLANELLEENHRSHAEIAHVYSQIRAVTQYLASMENHLALAAELEREEALSRNRAMYGEDADLVTEDDLAFMREVMYPRLFRGSCLVMLFATFEDAIYAIADGTARRSSSTITIEDFGGGVITKARKYFGELAKLSFPSGDSLARLKALNAVRNSFAHQAGSSLLDDLTVDARKKSARELRKLVDKFPDLSLVDGKYLVPSRQFAERSLEVVTEALVTLAREAAPDYLYHEYWELDFP